MMHILAMPPMPSVLGLYLLHKAATSSSNQGLTTGQATIIASACTAVAVLAVGILNVLTQRKQMVEQRQLLERQLGAQREQSNQQLEAQRDQFNLQANLMQSGQITDRFMRAVEHLGNKSSEVRVGAIFALERIADESPRDRPHIVNTLVIFVRNRLPESDVREGEYVQVLAQRVPDAQAALTALCRSPLSDDRRDWSEIGGLDLTRTDLRRANLRNANLSRANLWRCHLEGADLYRANLQDSNLGDANFNSFQPGNPSFKDGTDLRRADLSGAKFKNARHLDVALTKGAVSYGHTEWPDGFDWRTAGVELQAKTGSEHKSAKS
jgi:hypothetical protein